MAAGAAAGGGYTDMPFPQQASLLQSTADMGSVADASAAMLQQASSELTKSQGSMQQQTSAQEPHWPDAWGTGFRASANASVQSVGTWATTTASAATPTAAVSPAIVVAVNGFAGLIPRYNAALKLPPEIREPLIKQVQTEGAGFLTNLGKSFTTAATALQQVASGPAWSGLSGGSGSSAKSAGGSSGGGSGGSGSGSSGGQSGAGAGGGQSGDQSGGQAGDSSADQSGDQTGDQIGDQSDPTADQTGDPSLTGLTSAPPLTPPSLTPLPPLPPLDSTGLGGAPALLPPLSLSGGGGLGGLGGGGRLGGGGGIKAGGLSGLSSGPQQIPQAAAPTSSEPAPTPEQAPAAPAEGGANPPGGTSASSGGGVPPMSPMMGGMGGGGTGGAIGAGRTQGIAGGRGARTTSTPGLPASLRGKAGQADPAAFARPSRARRREPDENLTTIQLLDEDMWKVDGDPSGTTAPSRRLAH